MVACLLLITTLLVTFGTIAVASASEGQASANGGTTWSIMIHDLVYLGFGIFALYLASRVRLDRLVRATPVLILFGLGLLLAVRAIGVTSNGGKRWLNLHVIYLQPSELFKLFTVLFIAWLVQHHHDELGHWRQLAVWTLPVTFGCALIVIEPDIGTSSVVAVIAFAMLAVGGLSRKMLGRIMLLGVAAFGAYAAYKPYSAGRLLSFLHPNTHLLGSGYQLLQSRIGLGAGGVGGLGLGHSREKWGLLPNPHTDFIFTVIGEELGLIGTLAVVALFVAFLFAAVRIAQQCTNSVYRLDRGRHHHLDRRRGPDQHRLGRRVVGGHRDPAALLLLRWHGTDHRTGRGGSALQHRPRPHPQRRRDDSRTPHHQLSRDHGTQGRPAGGVALALDERSTPGPLVAGPIVITGGGTGGHIFPMVAIADELRALGVDAHDLRFVGSRRGQESALLATSDVALTLLPGRGFRRSFAPEALFQNLGGRALAGPGRGDRGDQDTPVAALGRGLAGGLRLVRHDVGRGGVAPTAGTRRAGRRTGRRATSLHAFRARAMLRLSFERPQGRRDGHAPSPEHRLD